MLQFFLLSFLCGYFFSLFCALHLPAEKQPVKHAQSRDALFADVKNIWGIFWRFAFRLVVINRVHFVHPLLISHRHTV